VAPDGQVHRVRLPADREGGSRVRSTPQRGVPAALLGRHDERQAIPNATRTTDQAAARRQGRAAVSSPRIGRADRLAALHALREAEDALGLPVGMLAATRCCWSTVRRPTRFGRVSPRSPSSSSRFPGRSARSRLASVDTLPTPTATPSSRGVVELVRGRAFDLFLRGPTGWPRRQDEPVPAPGHLLLRQGSRRHLPQRRRERVAKM